MKNLLFSAFMLLLASSLSAQSDVSLSLDRINNGRSIPSISAQYLTQAPAPGSGGRRSSSSSMSGTYCQIQRTPDTHSSSINNASLKGRFLKYATVSYTLPDGTYVKDQLENVVITEHTTTVSGSTSLESFKLFYQNKTTKQK